MITPPYLSENAKIALVAPARKISREEIASAIARINERGFVPVFDDRLFAVDNQFAGSDNHRKAMLQDYLDSPDIAAIMCVRGGYGSIRIIDDLNFDKFIKHPKWIVGYSDCTVFHARIQKLGFESLHATMPINFSSNTAAALESLYKALTGKSISYKIDNHSLNRTGRAEAEIVGGNLSVLYSMLGSDTFPDTAGKILFLEDLDEYLYHIDRMIVALKRAGKLSRLAGLVIGGLTQMHDNSVPFGKSAEEIIAEHIAEYSYPVCFEFPAGHIDDNQAIIMGRKITLDMANEKSRLRF